MTTFQGYRIMLLACLFAGSSGAQTLWKEPPRATLADWTWGPGGEAFAPRPPFQFQREKPDGTNPKVEVTDAAGRRWVVKFGSEVHSDTFAPRLLSALGYAATPTFYVAGGTISGTHQLKRAKGFIGKDGSFRNARFKLHERGNTADAERDTWSWTANPFLGSHELGGLKILIMLTSNWDTKDSRDAKDGSNTGMIRSASDSTDWYAVTDWGASLGKSGGFFRRDRWDWNGYSAQTPGFARLSRTGEVQWGFQGKHGQDIKAGVGVDEVRWILRYLSRITDEDLQTGLVASGATSPVARAFTASIRARIHQLEQIAQSSTVRQATK